MILHSSNQPASIGRGLSVMVAVFIAAAGLHGVAVAQEPAAPSAGPALPGGDEVDAAVAKALLDRGKQLYAEGDHASAKLLFIESLERSPEGPWAGDSMAMLRSANERLGLKDLEHGNPIGKPVDSGPAGPLDPYGDGDGTGTGDTEPVDPYGGDPPQLEEPVDPYGGGVSGPAPGPVVDEPGDPSVARRRITLWSASYGAIAGLALAGPTDEFGDTRGIAVLGALLGAGAGAGAAWYLLRDRELSVGQGHAVISAGAWGAYAIGLFGDTVTGVDSTSTNEGFKSVAIGGGLGTGAGIWLASKRDPSADDVGIVNSFGLYGTSAGLLLGVVMDPPESEAYSINAMLGAAGGLGIGYFVAGRADVSRRRMLRVDLGAIAGVAATWALFYPLVADGTTNNDEQAAGVLSLGAMGAGAYIAWRMTDGMDEPDTLEVQAREGNTLPGLVTRTSSGGWTLGAPLPRTMENPSLAPPTGAFNMGVDVLSGRF